MVHGQHDFQRGPDGGDGDDDFAVLVHGVNHVLDDDLVVEEAEVCGAAGPGGLRGAADLADGGVLGAFVTEFPGGDLFAGHDGGAVGAVDLDADVGAGP